jgi:dihydroorotase
MLPTTLIQGGTIVSSQGQQKMDVLIKDGKIAEVGEGLSTDGVEEVIEASGKFVLPGAIDVHVHLRTPGNEDKEDFGTGTQSAAAGGVTTVLDMPNNTPAVTSVEVLNDKKKLIEDMGSHVNYGLYMGATSTNIDEYLNSDAIALKVYMGSSTGDLLVDKEEWLREIFEKAGKAGRLVCVHAEDEALMSEHAAEYEGQDDPTVHNKIRDEEVALRAVERAIKLAHEYGTRLHVCHVSTQKELELLKENASDKLSFEVTPHHLFLDEGALAFKGNFAKMNPPLRSIENGQALLKGIKEGDVDMVSTDHAPHLMSEKEQPYTKAPSGVPGLETAVPLLLNAVNEGSLDLEDVVRVTSEGPAGVFGLESGMAVGADANVMIVDMDLEQTVANGEAGARFSKCGWSVFDGMTLKGWPVLTFVNGQKVYENEAVSEDRSGRLIGFK